MTITTLKKHEGNPPKTMEVLTDSEKFPCVTGDNASTLLNRFHGIGALRIDGYDVSPIKGCAVVFEIT